MFLPLMPMLLLLFSAGITSLFKWILKNPKTPDWGRWAVALIGAGLIIGTGRWFVMTGLSQWEKAQKNNPFALDAEFNAYNEPALTWTSAGHTPGQATGVLWGPSHSIPYWRYTDRLQFIYFPTDTKNFEAFEGYLDDKEVLYLIFDSTMISGKRPMDETRLGLLKNGDGRLEIGDFPADWALGYVGPTVPCDWCVFRRLKPGTGIIPVNVTFDNAIRLFGYQIADADFLPDGELVISLYWESLKPVEVDYTVFTQLLGPDFQLHGQEDKQPLAGRWGTSRWQSGQKFTDKFILQVDENAPPGEYNILIGFYDLNTGQRLPVQTDKKPVTDKAVWLDQRTIQEE